MDIESRFWQLCDEVAARWEECCRTVADEHTSDSACEEARRAYENAMIEIIPLVEGHPEARSVFVQCFSQLVLWERSAPWDLVPFCMRRLRFPEIPELIRRDAQGREGTAYYASRMNYWSSVNHAYLDEVWECALGFEFYRHEFED